MRSCVDVRKFHRPTACFTQHHRKGRNHHGASIFRIERHAAPLHAPKRAMSRIQFLSDDTQRPGTGTSFRMTGMIFPRGICMQHYLIPSDAGVRHQPRLLPAQISGHPPPADPSRVIVPSSTEYSYRRQAARGKGTKLAGYRIRGRECGPLHGVRSSAMGHRESLQSRSRWHHGSPALPRTTMTYYAGAQLRTRLDPRSDQRCDHA